jgi:protein-S-isoprenylcysteine O-methyltransferase Ste14
MSKHLELKVPPLALTVLTGLLMWLTAAVWPAAAVGLPFARPAAVLLAAAGAAACILGVARFRRHGTTVLPHRPEATARLVTDGIYRYTRNPMYVGMLMVLAGWALWLCHPGAAVLVPLCGLWLQRFQILPEERAMADRFGDEYRAYRRSVRRWL